MQRALTKAEVNHLRRLLGWLRCEDLWPTPEEQRATMASIVHALTEYPDEAAQARIMESYDRAASVPKYVRAAFKALQRVVVEQSGEIVDVDSRVREIAQSIDGPLRRLSNK